MKSVEDLVTSLTTKSRERRGSVSLGSLGLEDGSNGKGTFKVAVGVPPEMPGVIVKVLEPTDVCALFLWAVYTGVIESVHFPKVHAFVGLGDQYLAVMERCTGGFWPIENEAPDGTALYHNLGGRADCWCERDIAKVKTPSIQAAVRELVKLQRLVPEVSLKGDIHADNYAKRSPEDDTMVIFDPVFNRDVCDDVFEAYWPAELAAP